MTEKQITRKNRDRNDALSKNQSETKTRDAVDRMYVRSYLNLGYILDKSEFFFMLHMNQIHFIASLGYKTSWSKDFLMNRMDMNRRVFNRCEKRLIEMKLLKKGRDGKKIRYFWDVELYERLVSIVNASQDVFAVKEFCKTKFIAEKRGIDEITDQEIDLLTKAKWSKRKW